MPDLLLTLVTVCVTMRVTIGVLLLLAAMLDIQARAALTRYPSLANTSCREVSHA